MALIVKTDLPLDISDAGTACIHARPYEKPRIALGDEVFVWTSESAGGHGLAARGTVDASRVEMFPNASGSGEHRELVLDVTITHRHPARALTLEQLAPYRDAGRPRAEAALSRVLYKHSLNKITSIGSDASDFVRSHFGEN